METEVKIQRVETLVVDESEYEIWKPTQFDARLVELSEDEKKTMFFNRSVTSLLNKLTPENFSRILQKMKNLPIDTSIKMQRVVEMVHKKAIRERKYRAVYAKLCDEMRGLRVVNELLIMKSFSLYLIEACETFFENSLCQDFKFDRQKQMINSCSNQETKQFLLKDHIQCEYEFRQQSIGNCQFIGELFKVYMIYPKIVFLMLDRLFKANGNVAVECICSTITTIGPFYEEKIGQFPVEYFDRLKSLLSKERELSLRTRFFIQDVIDLRNRNWRFKKLPELPKTTEQLNQEMIEEERCQKLSESMRHLTYILKRNKTRERCMIKFNSEWTDISVHFFKYLGESKESKKGENQNQVQVSSTETLSSDESEKRVQISSPVIETQSSEEPDKSAEVPIPIAETRSYDDTVCETIRDMLEKLTFDNLENFAKIIKELSISNYSRLKLIADSVYELATSKPELCKLYAKLCNRFQNLHMIVDKYTKQITNFRNLILDECERGFNSRKRGDSESEYNRRLAINCRFIGELYNANVFGVAIIFPFIKKLLLSWTEVSIQRLLELLTVIEKNCIPKLKRLYEKDASKETEANNKALVIQRLTQLEAKVVELKSSGFTPLPGTSTVSDSARQGTASVIDAKIDAEITSSENENVSRYASCNSNEVAEFTSPSKSKKTLGDLSSETVAQKNQTSAPSSRKNPSIKLFNTLKSTLHEWSSSGKLPCWLDSDEMKDRLSSETFPQSASELIKYVMTSDGRNAENCGRLFVALIERGYIQPQSVIKGFGCLLSTVDNQEIPSHLELIIGPLFEKGYLKLDDLNSIFQRNSDARPNEKEEKKVDDLENKPASKEFVKNDTPVLPEKIPLPVQFVSPVASHFDPFSQVTAGYAADDHVTVLKPVNGGTQTPTSSKKIKKLVQDILERQTPSTFQSSAFKLEMERIPFQKCDELEFAARYIVEQCTRNDMCEFYADLCGPMMMLTAGNKRFWVMLMKACHTRFLQTFFPSGAAESSKKPRTKNKQQKKNNKERAFCRFFSLVVNKLNNETANVTTKRMMGRLLEADKIDCFCEMYNTLDWNNERFEKSLFESSIPALLSSGELDAESRDMLSKVVEDYTEKQRLGTQLVKSGGKRKKKQQLQKTATQCAPLVGQSTSYTHQQQLAQAPTKDRKNRIKIVDPMTGKEVNFGDTEQQQNDETTEKNEDIETNASRVRVEFAMEVSKRTSEPWSYGAVAKKESSPANSEEVRSKNTDKDFQVPDLVRGATNRLNFVQNLTADEMNSKVVSASSSDETTLPISHKKLSETVVDVLNQLESRPTTFLRLAQRLSSLPIDRESKLANVVHSICNRAMKSNTNCQLYVLLCENMQHWTIIDQITEKPVSFKSEMIKILCSKYQQFNLKIKQYNEFTELDARKREDIFEKVTSYCKFLCAVLKSPVFRSEIPIFPVIELLLLDPVDKNIIEILNEFLDILRNDLHLKLIILEDQLCPSAVVKSSTIEQFENYNFMFKIITLLQEVINFQKHDETPNNAKRIETNVAGDESTREIENRTKACNKRLDMYLETNPSVIDKTIKHFEELSGNPEEFIKSIVVSMCRSFHDEWKKGETVRNMDKEFSSYALLFKIFIKNIPSFEFHCVNALFGFLKNSSFPPGMMTKMFEALFLYEIICYESFVRFKNLNVSDKISDIIKILNSSTFQDYKLSQSHG